MGDKLDREHASNCVKNMINDNSVNVFSDLRKELSKEKIDYLFQLYDIIPFYTVSFCKSENEHLWENYADNHQGVRIAFEENIFNNCINDCNKKIKNGFSSGFDLLNFRDVVYGDGNKYIEDVFKRTEKNYNGENKWYYLLELIIYIVSGTIKSEKYEQEKEYRLLLKNIYSEQYLESAPAVYATYSLLQKERQKPVLESLGLDKLIEKPKEHFALNISDFLSLGVISEIVIGKNATITTDEVEALLKTNDVEGVSVRKCLRP